MCVCVRAQVGTFASPGADAGGHGWLAAGPRLLVLLLPAPPSPHRAPGAPRLARTRVPPNPFPPLQHSKVRGSGSARREGRVMDQTPSSYLFAQTRGLLAGDQLALDALLLCGPPVWKHSQTETGLLFLW